MSTVSSSNASSSRDRRSPLPGSNGRRGGARVIAGVAALALLGLAACGSDGGEQEGEGEGSEESTLTYATSSLGTEIWAPHMAGTTEREIQQLVSETLIRPDPVTREPSPGLAESWELSDDGLTWTFHLREGIQFHDDWGELTAEDVKFAWELVTSEESLLGRKAWFAAAVGDDLEKNFEIVDDYTFRLHTPEPQVLLPSRLGYLGEAMFIPSKAYWDEVGPEEASKHPIGTGPFRFVSHEPGVEVRLEAVDDHWRQTPAYDSLVVRIVSDEAARLNALQTGEADLAPISLSLLGEAEGAQLQIFEVPGSTMSSLYFGGMYPGDPAKHDPDAPWIQDDAPEQGLAIRQAISLAIDREAIIDGPLQGYGVPSFAPVAFFPGDFGWNDPDWDPLEYDPERAKELLAEGGYPDGFSVGWPIYEQGGRPASPVIATAVAGMLEEIGIDVQEQPMEYDPAWRQNLVDRTTAGYIAQFMTTFQDEPLDYLGGGSFSPEGGIAHFYSPHVTEYVQKMRSELDDEKRMALARELGTIMRDDVTSVALVAASTIYAANDRVAEWEETVAAAAEPHNLEYVVLTD